MRRIGLFLVLAVLSLSACSEGDAAAGTTSEFLQPSTALASSEPVAPTASTASVPETTTTTKPPETTVPTTWQPLEAGARVLLIGDSISLGYASGLQRALPDVEIVNPDENARSTEFALGSNRLYSWLGGEPWDVIHFNFGLHDLSFVDPQGNEARTDVDGAGPQVSLDRYEENLQRIVDILQTTDARLIWATTTPVFETSGSRLADAELAYNEVALQVMERNGIQVNDLHQFAIDNLVAARLGGADNIHYTKAGYDTMSTAVVEILLSTPTQ